MAILISTNDSFSFYRAHMIMLNTVCFLEDLRKKSPLTFAAPLAL